MIFGSITIIKLFVILAILVANLTMIITNKNNALIHDVLAYTVVVDKGSQMIFENQDELMKYKQKIALEKATALNLELIDVEWVNEFGTFILRSKGYGKKVMDLLHNDFCGLTELKIKKPDIDYIKSIMKKFDIDLVIKQEKYSNKWFWRAYLCGERVK